MSENLLSATSANNVKLINAAKAAADVKPIENNAMKATETKTNEEQPKETKKAARNTKAAAPKPTAAELQKEIERKQAELQKTLAELAAKQELNHKRSVFIDAVDKIEEAKNKLAEEKDSFTSSEISLQAIAKNASFREETIFTVKNPDILLEMFNFLKKKITDKIDVIEAELIK